MKDVKIKRTTMCRYEGPRYREFTDEAHAALCERYGAPGYGWYPIPNGCVKAFDGEKWRVFRSVPRALA